MSKAGDAALRGRKASTKTSSGRPRSAGVSKAGQAALGGRSPSTATPEDKAVAGVIDPTDIDKAEKSVYNKLKKITDSDAPGGEKKAAEGKAEGKHKQGWFMGALEKLAVPGKVIASTLAEVAEQVPGSKFSEEGNEGFSFGDIKRRAIDEDKGFGSYIDTGNKWANRAVGFVGDVATDPFSYLAPEAKIAQLGGKKGIAVILAEAGHTDVAAKVLRKGVSGLSKEERALAGIKGGLYFNVPGTGHVSKRVVNTLTGGKYTPKGAQVQVLKGGGMVSDLPRALQSIGTKAGDHSEVLKFLRAHAAGKNAPLKADLRSGDPVKSVQALYALQAMTRGPLKGMMIGALQGERMTRLIHDAEKSGFSLDDLTDAVAGDPSAIARAKKAGIDLDAHAAWWEESAQSVDDAAGRPVIKRTQNYVARIRSEAMRKLQGGGGGQPRGPHTAATFEHARVKPGDDWLGVDIHAPGSEVDGVVMPSVEKQMADVNAQVFGADAVPLYEQDYRKIVNAYLTGIGKRAGELHTEKLLRDKGVLAERYAGARASKGSVKRMAKAQRLEAEAEDLAEQEWVAHAEVLRLQRLLQAQVDEAGDTLTAAGREHAARAEALEAQVAEAVAEQEQIKQQIATRLATVQEARQRVSVVVGETNHPYERYIDLLDKRETLQHRIDELNELGADDVLGSGVAKKKLKNPYLREEVAARLQKINDEIAQLEGADVNAGNLAFDQKREQQFEIQMKIRDAERAGQPVDPALKAQADRLEVESVRSLVDEPGGDPMVRAYNERDRLTAQLEELEADTISGKQQRAEVFELNRQLDELLTKLDRLEAQPQVVAGLRNGLSLAEAKGANLRRLIAEREGAAEVAYQAEIDELLRKELGDPSPPTPDDTPLQVEIDLQQSRLTRAAERVESYDVQGDLHRRELERLGIDPDAPAGRDLPAIEHDINFVRESYTTSQARAAEWNAAKARANLYSGTANHADAVEAAEQIRRLKEATGFSSVEEVNQQARALRDYMSDLQREHYARRAWEGEILPEDLAGKAEQVRHQLNLVQAQRERLGVPWNEFDERLARLEHEVGELRTNADGVFEHGDRVLTPNARWSKEDGYNVLDDAEQDIIDTPPPELLAWFQQQGYDVGTGRDLADKDILDMVFSIEDPAVQVAAEPWIQTVQKMLAAPPGSSETQRTLWFHRTHGARVDFAQEPAAQGLFNTWGGLHAADNPMSADMMGPNRITFELRTSQDRVKIYGGDDIDPDGFGQPAFPEAQHTVADQGANPYDVYGNTHDYAEAAQEADQFRAAWDAGVLNIKTLADGHPRAAHKWNEVGKIMDADPDTDIVEAMAHVFGGGEADNFDPFDIGGYGDASHPLKPAFMEIGAAARQMSSETQQAVRKAYREAMQAEGYDAVLYWNVTEAAGDAAGGGKHWSIIVTNPAAARIVDEHGLAQAIDYDRAIEQYSARADTGVDPKLVEETRVALADQDEVINQAENAFTKQREAAQQNVERLRALEAEVAESVKPLTAKQKALSADELEMREEASSLWEQAREAQEEAAEPLVVRTLELRAAASQAEAKLAQLGHRRLEAQNLANIAMDKAVGTFSTQAVDALRDGLVPFGKGEMLPDHVAEALLDVQKVNTPEGMKHFLRYHDKALGLWKAYAIATPGFHFRNFFGGQFNMYLQGVDIGVQRRIIKADLQFERAFKKNLDPEEGYAAIKDARIRDAYKQLYETGLGAGGGQISNEVVRSLGSKSNANPLSTDFAPLRFSAKRGENLERRMRFASGADVLLKGGTIDDALDAVFKYHFNYDDLSKFERDVAKRLIPFYTWTRKNYTLQLEMLIRQPHKYKRYLDVKRNLELGTEEDEGAVPDYFGKNLGIRLPFQAGGESTYTLPDVPFKALAMDSPSEVLSSASPFVKTPMELWAGKQFFAGLPISKDKSVAPKAWGAIPGLMATLNTMGLAEKDKHGRYIMSGKNSYLIEQFLPPLQRARRLAPNEPKYQQRMTTTWLSFLFGASVRTNTVQGQYSEWRRRDRQLSAVVADLQDRGYLEKKETT